MDLQLLPDVRAASRRDDAAQQPGVSENVDDVVERGKVHELCTTHRSASPCQKLVAVENLAI